MAQRAAEPLAITGLGMATAVGLGAAAACAALRAGITRFREVAAPSVTGRDGEPLRVVAAPMAGVTDGRLGLGRFAPLVAAALRDLGAAAEKPLATAAIHLALPPAGRPGVDARLAAMLPLRLEQWCGLRGAAARTRVYPLGHAGVLRALEEAGRELAGGAAAAVVGGVDSLVEPETLAWLHQRRRLKTGGRPVGLVPGEAAAFLLLEPVARAEARGAEILALLGPAATATEASTVEGDAPCDGKGLAEAIGRALAGGPGPGLVIADLNGEPYRSEELGGAAVRALAGLGPYRLWHPADALGDTGAASAAVALAAGARALHRGYARTGTALVVASSDAGLRGAVALRAAPGKE